MSKNRYLFLITIMIKWNKDTLYRRGGKYNGKF